MSALDLARLQFAVTAGIHWTFVLVTLGMVVWLVTLETRAALARNPVKRELLYRMTRFWGLLYVINYAIGIASGIVMEFQFGTNWSGLSHVAGSVFGAPIAVETMVAFAFESTFLALWIFGWQKLPRWVHLGLLWAIGASAFASAFLVLVANGFMHFPRGYHMTAHGQADLDSVSQLLSNPSTIIAFIHICGAALAAGGVVITVVSSFHLFRRTRDEDFFVRSFRSGFIMGFLGLSTAVGSGFPQLDFVKEIQPGKFDHPGMGAFLGNMIVIGFFGLVIMFFLSPVIIGKLPAKLWWSMPLFWLALPLPFIAAVLGWLAREIGRQPWAIYGVQRTSDAVSHVGVGTMWASFAVFTTMLVALLLTNWWLIGRHATRGPNREIFGITPIPAQRPRVHIGGSNG
ncbi:MAG TPA: cytochrome ubiquinol oxidase subunit I [Stackebrandtia sp.]|jgi:cytochrome d ubiquinol oxidase subunit I|uniref:cytochrome ubiquinol oxidase subunit I n=1 Tax=Stackebrandtia sp. TaxID=2023065 RepID=UPI002D4D9D62|nr:cytochrome ubiquinol oxidase subunit I [Stackebrandtia sp.]HZE41032.1 cytochrome ubiquinol oxidase subunit I [Stackebrandtia sp.]